MSRLALLLALALPAAAYASGDAPFCVYSPTGFASCFYYSIDSCRSAAAALGGMCAPNNQGPAAPTSSATQAQARPQTSVLEMMRSIQAAADAGRQRALEQQEFEARMAVLRAQQEQAQAEAAAAQQAQASQDEGQAFWDAMGNAAERVAAQEQAARANDGDQGTRSLYRCPRSDGTAVMTYQPEPGCIFLGTVGGP